MTAIDLPDDFWTASWRRRPVLLKGGAVTFLPVAPDRADLMARIGSDAPRMSDGRTVWFFQGLTDGLPGVADLTARARAIFEWDDVWCDAFATVGPSSIGSHYDESDNFTIQLEGAKSWRLHPPDAIDPDERRRRLLGEPGVGRGAIPDGSPATLEFTVAAGDALYIPSLWIHQGVSDGDSVSVSLVVNSATAYSGLADAVLDVLRRTASWHAPLAIGPGGREARRAQVAAALDDLGAESRSRFGARAVVFEARRGRRPLADGPLDLDLDAVRDYIAAAPAMPVGGPGALDDPAMSAQFARTTLKRLLKMSAHRYAATSSTEVREIYRVALRALLAAATPDIDRVLGDPAVVDWLTAAEAEPAELPAPRREDPGAAVLATAALAEIAAQRLEHPITFAVSPGPDGWVDLPSLGRRFAAPSAPWVDLLVDDGGVSRVNAERRHRLDDGEPGVRLLPRSAHSDRVIAVGPAEHPADLIGAMERFDAAITVLATEWPAGAARALAFIRRVEPVGSGAPVTSRAGTGVVRVGPDGGDALIEEIAVASGRARLHALGRLVAVAPGPGDRIDGRPVSAHILAAVEGAHRARATAPRDAAGAARHRRDVTDAIRALRTPGTLTPAGTALIDDMEGLL